MTANYCKECNRLDGFCICGVEYTHTPPTDVTVDDVVQRSYEQMQLFERRLDAQEELIANMMLAYSEVTSTLEALILEVLAPRTDEEKEEFRKEAKKRHIELLKAMQEVTRGMERSGPDIGSAVEGVVGEDDSPTTEPQ